MLCMTTAYQSLLALLVLLFSFALGFISGCETKDPLAPEERSWLMQNNGNIIVNNESGWPPIIDTDKDGNPYGIVMDFQRLLEKKLNFKFKMDKPDSWKNFMERFKRGEIDVNNNLQKTPRRSEFALFTEPYIDIPNAIIVRKEIEDALALNKMHGMKIAVTNNFAIHKHIEKNYDDLNLIPMEDDLKCLLETSTRDVDAAVVNLAVASFLIEKHGIANLHVAGYADYANSLCFASRKDVPILNSILEKGLSLITQNERDTIYNKWISLGGAPLYKSAKFWMISGIIAAITVGIFVLVMIWNQSLKHQVRARTKSLADTNEQLKSEIQERKKAETSLRHSEEQYRRLAENSPDMIFRLSLPKGVFEYMSPAAEKVTGFSLDDFYQNPIMIRQSLHPDWKDYFKTEWGKFLKGRLAPTYEYQIIHKDKSIRWLNQRNIDVRDRNGKLVAIEGIVTDITERKQAEEALITSHIRFLNVLDSIDATIYVADMETYEILFMNKYMVDSFGRDMTGEICWKVFRNEDKPCNHCTNDQLVNADGNPSGVCVWKDKNPVNGKFYVNHDRAIEWSDGRLVRLQIATDVTDLTKMEERLKQAQKMEAVGRLAGGVAHDFNNMLSIISGNIEMVLEDINPQSPVIGNLREIHKAAQRSTDLTRQLLAFARKQTISPKVINLNNAIDSMLNMLRRLIGEDIDLAWVPCNDLWLAKIDPSQIDQVLANLCVNARDSIDGVGKVTIETGNVKFDENYCRVHEGFKPGEYVMIAVSDSGSGMDRGTLDKIFEPFFSTKDIGRGTGLGLSTVYGIAKQNDGFINAYSELGEGTTIKLYFPRHDITDAKRHIEKGGIEYAGGTETILLVEDEKGILRMTTTMLERLGYKVLPASNADDAIHISQTYSSGIDLLMTDVIMPAMNGRELAGEILQDYPDLKCLFMSGYTANVIAHHGVLDEGIHFINKPFSKHDLVEKLRKVFETED